MCMSDVWGWFMDVGDGLLGNRNGLQYKGNGWYGWFVILGLRMVCIDFRIFFVGSTIGH